MRWEGRYHREGGRERGELLWLKKESAGDQVTRRGVERESERIGEKREKGSVKGKGERASEGMEGKESKRAIG